jgi:endonuclease III
MIKNTNTIKKIIDILNIKIKDYSPTLITTIIKEYGKDPFLVLICCLLSLRAKDIVTIHVCKDLLKIAKTPQQILDTPTTKLEKIIYKIGFYKNKAKVLHQVCNQLINKHQGKVPANLKDLLNLSGVGRKTANLVMGLAYDKPAICVDIHVHRISNRLGLVETKTAEQTESELEKILPKKYWITWNDLLVKLGQNICSPISPWCSKCVIKKFCKQVGVKKSR